MNADCVVPFCLCRPSLRNARLWNHFRSQIIRLTRSIADEIALAATGSVDPLGRLLETKGPFLDGIFSGGCSSRRHLPRSAVDFKSTIKSPDKSSAETSDIIMNLNQKKIKNCVRSLSEVSTRRNDSAAFRNVFFLSLFFFWSKSDG